MRFFFFTVLCLFLLVAASFAQNPQPTITPQPKAVEENDVVKISTTLIQLDVTVTDKSGKIVQDLKPEDFEIYENGVKQDISNFSFISAATSKSISPNQSTKNKPENTTVVPAPANQLRFEQVRRTIALVIDDFHLSAEGVHFVRRALRKFVDEQMLPDDLVAVVQASKGIGALQQFTSDKRRLYAAIDSIKWNPVGDSGLTPFEPLGTDLKKLTTLDGASTKDSSLVGLRDPDVEAENFRKNVLAATSLNAIDYIVRGMKDLPGRKAMMLFSEGFRFANRGVAGRETDSKVVYAMEKLIDSAARSSVVFYTIDTRGLEILGLTAADKTSDKSQVEVQMALNSRQDTFFDNIEGLEVLAEKTGGRVFFNNNDYNKSLDQALNEQKGYYLIGYQPDAETFDGKAARFNNLQVKVRRENVNVRYRSGFFATPNEEKNSSTKPSVAQQLTKAINSPFAASQINVRFNALFGSEPRTGAYVRSLLHINAKDLQFTVAPNGEKRAVFDVLAMAFDENGIQADKISSSFTLTADAQVYQKIISEGVVYNFIYPVKKPGAYQMRVAIRDRETGKIGSASQFIEVPNLKSKRLTLSGIVLENLTIAQWQKINQNSPVQIKTDPMVDTSLRRFKRETVLRYGVEIYNARAENSQLSGQIKIFRDGKLILTGNPSAIAGGQNNFTGAINLGTELVPGDYLLQIIVTDNQAKEKNKVASQWVQFEIVE